MFPRPTQAGFCPRIIVPPLRGSFICRFVSQGFRPGPYGYAAEGAAKAQSPSTRAPLRIRSVALARDDREECSLLPGHLLLDLAGGGGGADFHGRSGAGKRHDAMLQQGAVEGGDALVHKGGVLDLHTRQVFFDVLEQGVFRVGGREVGAAGDVAGAGPDFSIQPKQVVVDLVRLDKILVVARGEGLDTSLYSTASIS